MKFEQTILDINDKVAQQRYTETVTDEEGTETQKISSKDLTLGSAITDAVLIQVDEATISEEDHLMRYGIYSKVRKGDTSFTEEEVSLIKSCIVKRYVPLFAGQLLILINE